MESFGIFVQFYGFYKIGVFLWNASSILADFIAKMKEKSVIARSRHDFVAIQNDYLESLKYMESLESLIDSALLCKFCVFMDCFGFLQSLAKTVERHKVAFA